jgi:quercetin dioxygenase-like cupin family protein
MKAFNLNELLAANETTHRAWLEFLRVSSLSMGLYRLKAGQEDPQKPHSEDEVYYVLKGKARFRSGNESLAVGPGSLILVERLAEHRFYEITEDLTVLVFFAPPEGSMKESGTASGRTQQERR